MIAPETLAQVSACLAQLGGLSDTAVAALRQAWPDIHFTACSEDDVPARVKPADTGDGYAIYLVSNAQHCIGFTSQLEAATGLVLAANSGED